MLEILPALAVIVVAVVILATSIKVAEESERFAVFTLGRFHAFMGPGLIMVTPFTQRMYRLKVGDVGELKSSEFAQFGDVDIPITGAESLTPGQAVRIDGFDGAEPRIAASSAPRQSTCPKCGHQF